MDAGEDPLNDSNWENDFEKAWEEDIKMTAQKNVPAIERQESDNSDFIAEVLHEFEQDDQQ